VACQVDADPSEDLRFNWAINSSSSSAFNSISSSRRSSSVFTFVPEVRNSQDSMGWHSQRPPMWSLMSLSSLQDFCAKAMLELDSVRERRGKSGGVAEYCGLRRRRRPYPVRANPPDFRKRALPGYPYLAFYVTLTVLRLPRQSNAKS